jgi:hypothetical protein
MYSLWMAHPVNLLSRYLHTLHNILLLFREKAVNVILISAGVYLIVHDLRPGAAWGSALVCFGAMSLRLQLSAGRERGREDG